MATQSTSTHTIVLAPGECFTLPSGGELIYVSDSANLDSECDIPTFDVTCYSFRFENVGGSPIDDAAFIGILIDGTYYEFAEQVDYDGHPDTAALRLAIEAATGDGLFMFEADCSDDDGGNPRMVFNSVGTDIFLKVINPTGYTSVGGANTYFYIKGEEISPCGCEGDLV